jgi:hypothetical protein
MLCKQQRKGTEKWDATVFTLGTGRSFETLYPVNQFPLVKETTYKVIIKASNSESSASLFEQTRCDEKMQSSFDLDRYPGDSRKQFPVTGLAFELINDKTFKEKLCTALQDKENRGLIQWNKTYDPDNARRIAEIYSENHLHADAINVLESIDVKHGRATQEPRAYVLLSEQYYKIGLDWQSLDALNRAFMSATKKATSNVLNHNSNQRKANLWEDKNVVETVNTIQKRCIQITKSLMRSGEKLQFPPCQQVYKANYYREKFHQGFPMMVMPAQKPGCLN